MAIISRKRKKHRQSKTTTRKKFLAERFVTSYLFKIAGFIVLLAGIYYAFTSLGIIGGFSELTEKLFRPSEDIVVAEGGNNLDVNILLYFLPGVLMLIVSGFLAKRIGFVSVLFAFAASISFVMTEGWIALNNPGGNIFYPAIVIGNFFLLTAAVGLFIIAIRIRKSIFLHLNCGCFYISSVLLAYNNVAQIGILLTLSILFTIGIAWAAQKINKPGINLVNFIFVIVIFGLHWLRKLAVNSRTEFLVPLFIFGVLYYILFYAVVSYSSGDRERPMPKWMQLTMSLASLLFVAGTSAYTILKYSGFGYLWIFALALLIINLLGLYLSGKHCPSAWKLPHHLATMVLAALILPLMLDQSALLLFTAGLSVLLLLYSKYAKHQPSIMISMIFMGVMTLIWFFQWAFIYVLALAGNDLPAGSLVVNGILSGVAVAATLAFNNWLLKHIDISLSKKLFSRTMYIRLIRGLILLSLFLTIEWTIATLLCVFTATMPVAGPAWFLAGSLFFILLILFQSKKLSSFYKPFLFSALAYTLTYPFLVYMSVMETLGNLMLSGPFSLSTVVVHYFALGSGICMAAIALVRVYKLYPKNILLQRGLQLTGILFLLFILVTEYDILSIILQSGQFIDKNSLVMVKEILENNRHLPYSAILMISSLFIIIWALFKNQKFLRNLSLLIFSMSIVKVFLYDFALLGDLARTVLLFLVGFLLIGLSILYPRLKKATTPRHAHHHHKPRPKLKNNEIEQG